MNSLISTCFPVDWVLDSTKINELTHYIVDDEFKLRIQNGLKLNKPLMIDCLIEEDIKRYENVKLYLQYCIEKEALKRRSTLGDSELEEYLWYPLHKDENPVDIIRNGFDTANLKELPGMSDLKRIGKGVHMFRNIFNFLDVKNTSFEKTLTYSYLLCRCLVGKSMITRNEINDVVPPGNFDTIENVDKSVVVIYNATCIYPQFLVKIQFKKKTIKSYVMEEIRKFTDEILYPDASHDDDRSIIFSYGSSASRGLVFNPNPDDIDNIQDSDDGYAANLGIDRPAIRKKREKKHYTIKERIYFPPKITNAIIQMLKMEMAKGNQTIPMIPEWQDAYWDSDPGGIEFVKFHAVGFQSISSIYSAGNNPFTMKIRLGLDWGVQIKDDEFIYLQKRRNRSDVRSDEDLPTIYRDNFPLYPEPSEVDMIIWSCQARKPDRTIRLPKLQAKMLLDSDLFNILELRDIHDILFSEGEGDYNIKDQSKYLLPIKIPKPSKTVFLEINDPNYKLRERKWPPKITDFDYEQLKSITQGLRLNSFFRLKDLAKIIENYGDDESFQYIALADTSLEPWPKQRGGAFDKNYLDGSSYVIPVSKSFGVRILDKRRESVGGNMSASRPYQKKSMSQTFDSRKRAWDDQESIAKKPRPEDSSYDDESRNAQSGTGGLRSSWMSEGGPALSSESSDDDESSNATSGGVGSSSMHASSGVAANRSEVIDLTQNPDESASGNQVIKSKSNGAGKEVVIILDDDEDSPPPKK